MTNQSTSYRRILRTTTVTGGASVIVILSGILRMKLIAIILGPSGVGIASLYTSFMTTATAVASFGIGTAGTKEVASAASCVDDQKLLLIRKSILILALMLACISGSIIWMHNDFINAWMHIDVNIKNNIVWLAIGVGLSVASISQTAFIQGMRRINDLARISLLGSFFNLIIGVFVIYGLGYNGLIFYVIVGPIVNYLLGYLYFSRICFDKHLRISGYDVARQGITILRLGMPFMAASIASAIVEFWIRMEIKNSLGIISLGHYQAAWIISMQYIGIVLSSMGVDYFPRLVASLKDKNKLTQIINEQTEIALLICIPIIIGMISLSHFVIYLLYSADFYPAKDVLKWQILGDVLKIISWPLGFLMLASGAGRLYLFTELVGLLILGSIISILIKSTGLEITGIAYLASYSIYLSTVYFIAKKNIDFSWSKNVQNLIVLAVVSSVMSTVACELFIHGKIYAFIFSLVLGLYSIYRIANISNIVRILKIYQKIFTLFNIYLK